MTSRLALDRRGFLSGTAAVGAGLFAPAVFTRPAWAQDSADVIFSGGTIITMNAAAPRAAALAVRDGRIMAVGAMDALDGLRGSNTRIVDLDGRTMTP